MSIEEELLAQAIHYLNNVLQHDQINSMNLDSDKYEDGTKRISVTIDYIPKEKE